MIRVSALGESTASQAAACWRWGDDASLQGVTVRPGDVRGVAVTLGAITVLVSDVPVRRATAIDPIQALRLE